MLCDLFNTLAVKPAHVSNVLKRRGGGEEKRCGGGEKPPRKIAKS